MIEYCGHKFVLRPGSFNSERIHMLSCLICKSTAIAKQQENQDFKIEMYTEEWWMFKKIDLMCDEVLIKKLLE